MRQEVRLKDRTAQSMLLLEEGRQAYGDKKYSRAVDLYRQALDLLPQALATATRREYMTLCLSDAYIATAIDYKNVGRTDEAREMLEQAAALAPSNKRAEQELVYLNDSVRTNPALTPGHVGAVEEVSRLLTLANGYFNLGRYDKAIETFQDVLRHDATNTAAQQGIARAERAREHYYRTARDAGRAQMLADVTREWDMNTPSGAPTVAAAATNKEPTVPDLEEDTFQSSLGSIVLPRVIFQDATIFEILESLQSQIRRYEESGGSSRPLNLTYNFGDPNAQVYKDLSERRVSIDLTDIPLKALFDIVGAQTGTTWYPSEVGFEFTLSGKDYGPMIDESFHVPSKFFTDTGEDETSEEDAFAITSSRLKVRRIDPVKALRGMGITFPKGAGAKYLPESSTLRVHNTAANIDEIRDLVSTPIEGERIVLLNVTMIEVNENDLRELGFEWLLDVSLGAHTYGAGGQAQDPDNPAAPGLVSPNSTLGLASTATRAPFLSAGLRSGTQVIANNSIDKLIQAGTPAGYVNKGDSPAPGILAVRGVWTVADVTMIMRGLDQKKSASILENPRVIFTPGRDEQVTFANVREMYYPEDYDPPELSNNNSTTPIAIPAHPSSFERFSLANEGGVGTTLLVHDAEVGDGGNHVTLSLTTLHNSFDGFINYGNPIMMPTLDQQGNIDTMMLTENKIVKPIFTRKCLNTKITAEPGSVIVMGGLLNSKRVRYQDKIPVLGDLPMVGRLFRSEGSENERTALIIFAKIDLVDPAGHDIRTGERPSAATDAAH